MVEGRVVTPPRLPVCCRCANPKPVVHNPPYYEHWCIACGGFLGDGARFHDLIGSCGCRKCAGKGCVLGENNRTGGFIGTTLQHTTIAQGYPAERER